MVYQMKEITLKQAINELDAKIVWHKNNPISIRIEDLYTLITGNYVIIKLDENNIYKINF